MKKSKKTVSNETAPTCIINTYNMEVDDQFGTSGDTRVLHLTIHVTERAAEYINIYITVQSIQQHYKGNNLRKVSTFFGYNNFDGGGGGVF